MLIYLFLFVGECSAAQIEAIQDLHPENMINCHLRFKDQNLDIPASEVFSANTDFDFDSGKYSSFEFQDAFGSVFYGFLVL